MRLIVYKAGKTINKQNTIIAKSRAQNDFLTKKLDSIKLRGRRPIYKDLNNIFADYQEFK